MALAKKVTSFLVASSDTAGTNIDVTLGFQPKAFKLWATGRSDATDAVGSASLRRCIGFGKDDSNRGACATASENGAAAADADSYQTDAAVFIQTTSDGTLAGALDVAPVAQWPADGVRFVVDTQFVASQRIDIAALGGTDITDVAVFFFPGPTATGNYDITTPGFQGSFALFAGIGQLTAPPFGSGSQSILMVGAAVSASEQFVVTGCTDEGSPTMDTGSYAYNGECLAVLSASNPTTSPVGRDTFVSWLANGFRLNRLESLQAFYVLCMVVKGPQAAIASLTTKTDTTTDIVVSGLPFAPAMQICVSHCKALSTQDTAVAIDEISIGAATSTTERGAQACLDENGTGTAEITTAIEYDEVYINLTDTGASVEGLMDVKSFDSGGITCIMDDADPVAAFVGCLLIGPAGAAPQTLTATPAVARWVGIAAAVTAAVTVSATPAVARWLAPVATATATVTLDATPGVVRWIGVAPSISLGTNLTAAPAIVRWIGVAPDLTATITLTPSAAIVRWVGIDAAPVATITLTASPAIVRWLGVAPSISVGTTLTSTPAIVRWLAAIADRTATVTVSPSAAVVTWRAVAPTIIPGAVTQTATAAAVRWLGVTASISAPGVAGLLAIKLVDCSVPAYRLVDASLPRYYLQDRSVPR